MLPALHGVFRTLFIGVSLLITGQAILLQLTTSFSRPVARLHRSSELLLSLAVPTELSLSLAAPMELSLAYYLQLISSFRIPVLWNSVLKLHLCRACCLPFMRLLECEMHVLTRYILKRQHWYDNQCNWSDQYNTDRYKHCPFRCILGDIYIGKNRGC